MEKYEGTKGWVITPKGVGCHLYHLFKEDYPLFRWLTYEEYIDIKDDYWV